MVKVGTTIPDFEVDAFHNNEVKKIKFSNYRGKWMVFLFYPADFTFVCPTELKEAADMYSSFTKEGAEVFSVSTDTAYSHKAWWDSSKSINCIKYPMIADPTGKVCRAFGTMIEEAGLSLRASLVVDPDGILKSYEIHDNSIGRNTSEILRKLQAAKFVREHGGEVCPASWKPGADTLKPNLNMVGKI